MTLEPILLFEITLDLCPSVNVAYPQGRSGLRHMSKDAAQWKGCANMYIKLSIRKFPWCFPISDPVRVERHFIFKDKRRRDYNNYIKLLDDALVSGGILKDDCISILAADSNTHEINPGIDRHLVRVRVYSF